MTISTVVDGLVAAIADRVHGLASVFAEGAKAAPGCSVPKAHFFDTVSVSVPDADKAVSDALALGCNIRKLSTTSVSVSFDETSSVADVDVRPVMFAVMVAK